MIEIQPRKSGQMSSERAGWLSEVDPIKFAYVVLAVVFFYSSPFAFLICACLIAVVVPSNDLKWLFLACSCALFTTLNMCKQVDGDLVNYISLQEYLSVKPFYTLFDEAELTAVSGSYRITEIGFYATLWGLSRVCTDPQVAIASFATVGIYVPTFLGIWVIATREKWGNDLIVACAVFAFFAAINFVQTTHLLRQYISSAFVFLAFGLFLAERVKIAFLVALYACLVHNGTLLLATDIFIISRLFPFRPKARINYMSSVVRLLSALPLIGFSVVLAALREGEHLAPDEATITIWHYLVVGVFYLGFAVTVFMGGLRLRSLHYLNLAFLIIFSLSLGFFVVGLNLYALRYFAYLEWLFGPMVAGILYSLNSMPRRSVVVLRFASAVFAISIMIFRVRGAPWDYGPGPNEFLTWDYREVVRIVGH